MNRLTYQEPDGSWGVAGMNADNEGEKLVAVARKLRDYENTELDPEDVAELKLQVHRNDGQLSAEEVWSMMAAVCDGECEGCPIAELNDPDRGQCPFGTSYEDIRETCRCIKLLQESK